MRRTLPYRMQPMHDPRSVVPRSVAEQLAAERDALASQLKRAKEEITRLRRTLHSREDERTHLLDVTRTLENQVRALRDRSPDHGAVRAARAQAEAHAMQAQRDGEQARQKMYELSARLTEITANLDAVEAENAEIIAERDALRAAVKRAEAQARELESSQPDQARTQRLAADLANLRRRRDEDIALRVRTERRVMLGDLLDVRDSLTRAVDASPDSSSPWHHGMVGILQQVDGILQRQRVTAIGQVGEAFDPNVHEATGMTPYGGSPPGYIVAVQRAGFVSEDGGLIRPARVVVSQ